MLYETLVEEEFETAVDDVEDEGAPADEPMSFVPLLAIGEADEFSAAVGQLEEAGIPWYVESDGKEVVLFVAQAELERAHQLMISAG